VRFHGKESCIRLSNDTVEIVASLSAGPRLLRYGLVNGGNLLGYCPERSTATALGEWRPLGGHRLWAAPEEMPGSYAPDGGSIDWRGDEYELSLAQHTDASGLAKTMRIRLEASGPVVTIDHGLQNCGLWPVEIAPWALTIMAPGGFAVLPQPRYRSHDEALRPVRVMALWPFTDLTDARWYFGKDLITLHPTQARPSPQKLGILNERGWVACVWPHDVFMKRVPCEARSRYPDGGVNNEVYAEGDYLEIETLGGLVSLEPGEWTWHTERWTRFNGLEASHLADEEALHALLDDMAKRTWPEAK
jgi:hypothetical protein